jgi:hypothetical protein
MKKHILSTLTVLLLLVAPACSSFTKNTAADKPQKVEAAQEKLDAAKAAAVNAKKQSPTHCGDTYIEGGL